ncbi:unnamed protein product [Periconia digitata]|uniref:Uncharacterized protein n=1 Tax=Periconia digitata TaxID=1303443 RepID=A0A9W4XVP2_9PLEO|nr:unnamed protein product [Periconia digitata]
MYEEYDVRRAAPTGQPATRRGGENLDIASVSGCECHLPPPPPPPTSPVRHASNNTNRA